MNGRVVRMLDRDPDQKPVIEVAGFVIESDVPQPMARGKANPIRQAMEALEVGQSFLIPGAKSTSGALGIAKLMKGRAFRASKRSNGVRVWRVK